MIQSLTDLFMNWLKTQGVITVFLVAAIVYFYNDNQEIKADLKECDEKYDRLLWMKISAADSAYPILRD